jgi:hypothetical protein
MEVTRTVIWSVESRPAPEGTPTEAHKAEGAVLELIEVDPINTFRVCTKCGRSLHADLKRSPNVRLRTILGRQGSVKDGLASRDLEVDRDLYGNGKLHAKAGST